MSRLLIISNICHRSCVKSISIETTHLQLGIIWLTSKLYYLQTTTDMTFNCGRYYSIIQCATWTLQLNWLKAVDDFHIGVEELKGWQPMRVLPKFAGIFGNCTWKLSEVEQREAGVHSRDASLDSPRNRVNGSKFEWNCLHSFDCLAENSLDNCIRLICIPKTLLRNWKQHQILMH